MASGERQWNRIESNQATRLQQFHTIIFHAQVAESRLDFFFKFSIVQEQAPHLWCVVLHHSRLIFRGELFVISEVLYVEGAEIGEEDVVRVVIEG